MNTLNDEEAIQESEPAHQDAGQVTPTSTYDELFAKAQDAITALRSVPRPGGPIRKGEMLNLRHGLNSEKLLDNSVIKAFHTERVQAITADLGGDEELTSLKRASVREAARLEVILAALGEEMLATGVLSAKGRVRATATLYLAVLDKFSKLSTVLGMERRAKRVASLHEVLDGK